MNSNISPTGSDPVESLSQAFNRVMREAQDWKHIMSLEADAAITVYLDMKSPHAYIAVRPTLELARDFRVRLDFRPYTLSYTGMGISISLENNERRPPSAEADRRARMFYKTARQYTALQRIPLRSPYRLLDASLAHRTFLFSKKQMLEIPFMMSVCLRGWGSGWRDIEIESIDQMRNTLNDLKANLDGYETFVEPGGQGEQELTDCMEEANASGFVGTPHYVFQDVLSGRQIELFGREHLTLIRSKLLEQDLARNDEVRAEFSHAWKGP
mgnify:FL=1